MNSQYIKAKVIEKKEQISILHQDIKILQEDCKHEDYAYKNKGDTGNWDRGDDSWWTEFKCNTCQKQWHEDGSLSRHKYMPV
jgi:hypothetical protein